MILENFPQKLRKEAQLWRDEGLISSSQYEQIAERYKFKNLEAAARDRNKAIAIAIGSILLCLGITTFVAGNWQGGSREVKFILMMSLFFAIAITGFYSWRQPEGKKVEQSKRLLGEGLLILSAFIFGAKFTADGPDVQYYRFSFPTFSRLGVWCCGDGLQFVLEFFRNSINCLGGNRLLDWTRRLVVRFR
ncbi:hypothetical protein ANSO36C_04810 [Nostoc cf. commune SO-36]|uniref:DUF2157 domain-containing protein n=1 Tax=Nostoc cf. commune SO-36 TaxID=449208 RepID=A0ABN6PWD4_NOSCO|nr:DUF2157 domain-containing protein [Nostoc commune]BDI14679.1 hypothetical protein ANSO36C_04810 [Nostoc cf. commune SO-36]